MPKINVHTDFTFVAKDKTRTNFKKGEHEVDWYTASHPYTKFHSEIIEDPVDQSDQASVVANDEVLENEEPTIESTSQQDVLKKSKK